jgi:tRNA(adenine34) deaminase
MEAHVRRRAILVAVVMAMIMFLSRLFGKAERRGNMSPIEDKKWMTLALGEAALALKNGEIPVASILVSAGKELSRSQTMVSRKGTLAAHGELFAILEANGKLWAAEHPLVIYTTLEPCLMCVGAAMQVGVDEIVFGMEAAPDGGARYQEAIAKGGQKPPVVRGGVLEAECVALMRRLPIELPKQPAVDYVRAMLAHYDARK